MNEANTKLKAGYVLVVDDEEHNRSLLRDTLEARNYEIAEAVDGAEALALVVRRVPDVILLDVMMPRLDGFDVCREIKRNPSTAAVPVLLITALSERKERLMGIEAGANDFLTKPVDLQDMLLRVGNAVYTKRLYDQLQLEQQKSERLLLSIFPKPVAERMKAGETNLAETYADATVLFADLVGFTRLAAHIAVNELLALLNEVFSAFDSLTESHGLEKIKTIGDAYMAAGGLAARQNDSAISAVRLAMAMHQTISEINDHYNTSLRLRIGISQGPVIAGVIGRTRFSYDLWGDTVNIASRLESLAEPGGVQVSEAVHDRIKGLFECARNDLADPKTGAIFPGYVLKPQPASANNSRDDTSRHAA